MIERMVQIESDEARADFSKRLNDLMSERGYPFRGRAAELARLFGISAKGAGKWLNGDSIPEIHRVQKLADLLNSSVEWLLSGKNPAVDKLRVWEHGDGGEDGSIDLPYLREAEFAAGSGRTMVVEQPSEKLRFNLSILREAGVDPMNAACGTNRGDSMADFICDGSAIGIDKGKTEIKDGKVYAIDHDGQLRVKYVHRLPGGGLRFRSHNKAYSDEDYTAQDVIAQNIRIIGWVFWRSTVDRW